MQLNLVINDLSENNCIIKQFIGDNPKRATAKCSLCHSSWYPCEYCTAKGTKMITNNAEITKQKRNLAVQIKIVRDKIIELKRLAAPSQSEIRNLEKIEKELVSADSKLRPRKSNIVWPKTTATAPPRTRQGIFDIIQKIENDVPLTADEAQGITGRSLLFDLPYFNFVRDVPVDYLHCVCIGVVKRSVELTFRVGENRTRVTKRPLSSPILFNLLISKIKVVREFNRRVRDLDFAVYKGQEYRNLLLFFFPLILNCIEQPAKERQMWLLLTYVIKACVIPTEEFRAVPIAQINASATKFYSVYQQLFGMQNCTYNTHIVGSHAIEMRFHGPLTFTSAFPFESFYGEMRNSFVPGTISPLKQIFSNVLIKRAIANHSCKSKMYISPKDTPMECNSMIYCFNNLEYTLYKVKEKNENTLICHRQEKLPCSFPETPTLNFSKVGVFKKGNIVEENVSVPISSVKGKIVVVNDFLITCPENVLMEK